MKTKFLILAVACLIATTAVAQTEYYDQTKVIERDGYAYKCDVTEYFVTLYNAEGQFTYADWTNRDGSKINERVALGDVETTESDSWTRPLIDSIISNAFTEPEKEKLKEKWPRLSYTVFIDPQTGKVAEISFEFPRISNLRYIPIETFRSIEQQIKEKIWYVVTPAGKKLNYCLYGSSYEFE